MGEEKSDPLAGASAKDLEMMSALFDALQHKEGEKIDEANRHFDFTKGIMLGLVLGIIGNLFVQFAYPVVEHIVQSSYDMLFRIDSVASIIILAAIIIIAMLYKKQMNAYSDERRHSVARKDLFYRSQIEVLKHKPNEEKKKPSS